MQKKYKEVVIPFWKGILFPLDKVIQNFGAVFLFISCFSVLSALVSMFIGRGFACGIGFDEEMFFCKNSIWNLTSNMLLMFMLAVLFIRRWWLLGFNGKTLGEVCKTKIGIKDLKIAGGVFLFLFFGCMLGVCVYVLYVRKATPHLNFELAWFFFISLFILAILFVLTNAVVFIRFLEGKKWFVFSKTALPVFDNIYKLIGWVLVYMLFFAYLVQQAGMIFVFCRRVLPLVVASFMGDFALYFVFYLMIVCVISLLKYQEGYIFEGEKD